MLVFFNGFFAIIDAELKVDEVSKIFFIDLSFSNLFIKGRMLMISPTLAP